MTHLIFDMQKLRFYLQISDRISTRQFSRTRKKKFAMQYKYASSLPAHVCISIFINEFNNFVSNKEH